MKTSFWKQYRFPIILLFSIIIGSILGIFMGEDAEKLKPLGSIFLNLMFTIVVPLVIFSISSVIANMGNLKTFAKISSIMLGVFAVTGIISAIIMIFAVVSFPPAEGVNITLEKPENVQELTIGEQIVQAVTVTDFVGILSSKNMLAVIIMSVLIGIATNLAGEKGRPFAKFLESGAEVFRKIVSIIMYYAPIGLGAYFASLVGVFGPELLGSYAKAVIVYYPVSILYFFIGFTLYAFIAGGKLGVQKFWKNILPSAAMSLSTGSSVATIPTNLEVSEKIGIPKDERNVVIPLGATIHMDGSALGAILKISFIFGIFNMEFNGIWTFLTAIGIALLVGTVMGGVPGGGFIGEMLIVTMYGLPLSALPILALIGTLIDPPATMVNASGDNVCAMLVSRFTRGKNWLKEQIQ